MSMAVLDEVDVPDVPVQDGARERVLAALETKPASVRVLRQRCRIKTMTLCDLLTQLVDDGNAEKVERGYRRTAQASCADVSPRTPETPGNGNGKRNGLSGETQAGSAGEQPAEG